MFSRRHKHTKFSSRRLDSRTRRDRTNIASEQWGLQIDALVASYLEWRVNNGSLESDGPAANTANLPVVTVEELDVFCEFYSLFPSLLCNSYY